MAVPVRLEIETPAVVDGGIVLTHLSSHGGCGNRAAFTLEELEGFPLCPSCGHLGRLGPKAKELLSDLRRGAA